MKPRVLNLLQVLFLTFFSTLLFATAPIKQSQPLPKDVSKDWYTSAMKNLEEAEYNFSKVKSTPIKGLSDSYQAPNRAQNLRAYVGSDAFYMTPRTYKDKTPWVWGMKLDGYGDSTNYHKVHYSKLEVEKNRVSYQREALSEWYTNSKKGIEQGFSIPKPITKSDTTLIKLQLLGDLDAKYSKSKKTLQLFSKSGVNVLNFGELKSYDADNRLLKSTMSLEGEYLVLKIATKDVKYPVLIDPLATTPSTILEENQADASFGRSVASAGDVNGDGYSDVIVGAPYYDNGQSSEGAAFIYLGSSSGVSSSASVTLEENQASAFFGRSVASADINGDGYSDVIVGANRYDNGQLNEGAVFVYLGSSYGVSSSASVVLEENQASAFFGHSVSSAGDVNGDGYSDVIVGAYLYDNGQTNEGAAYIYLGSSSGLSSSASVVLESNQANAEFGRSVSSAGDVNGDGYSDIIIGAFKYDNGHTNEGVAFVYLGSSSGVSSSASVVLEENQASSFFGFSVASAGDINGDGYSDVIVGAYLYDYVENDEGAVFVYLGSSSGLSNSASNRLEVNQADSGFGYSVASAGDINGDGYSDVLIGAPYYDNSQADEGAAFIYLGSSSGFSNRASVTLEENQADAYFGQSVASIGDVNGDGYSDVIVGAYRYDNGQADEGTAFIYLGSSSGYLHSDSITLEENQADASFGFSVASAGDVNGDGYSDVIVGAYRYDNGQTDEGAAFVYLGSSSGVSSSASVVLESNQASARFGYSVASTGDVNGDGYSDVIVGAYRYDNGQTNEGVAFVYLGNSIGVSSSATVVLEENQAYSRFGHSVASAGDVNGDGYSDVVVGSYYYDNGQTNEGTAFIYLGSSSGLSSGSAVTLEENQASAHFGYSVASAGDVNGDGYSDVIVGAYGYDNGQTDEGVTFIYLGSSTGVSSSGSIMLEENQADAYFGHSVSSAGDVNGDGYSDVIVGAYGYDSGQNNEGTAFVYLGSSSGVSSSASVVLEANQENALYGYSVSSAGDVNGDGYSDVIVGAYHYDNDQTNEGTAFIYLGSSLGVSSSASAILEENHPNISFGYSVASIGDVNGDGYSDVIVGAYGYDNGQNNEGAAFIYLGSSLGVSSSSSVTLEENQAGAYFGGSVASAGDVNGDGYSDVVVGAYRYDRGEGDEGVAFVYLGSSSGLSSSASVILEEDQAGAYFGQSVASAGDVNGDGYSDVLVGAPFYDNGQADEGVVFIYLGSSAGVSSSAAVVLEENQAYAFFGYSVSSAGDVNGDGYSDVVVGSYYYDNGQTNEGAAFIYLGSSSGISSSSSVTLEENQVGAHFGHSVASAGDVNGDGYSDVIVGAHAYDNEETGGVAFIYLGSSTGVLSSGSVMLEENQAYAFFGFSVASAGDVNGDGYSDVLVGAPFYDNGQADEGVVFIYLGSSAGVSSSAAVVLEENQAYSRFGDSASSAGDVDGDGYSDVVVGAYRYNNGQADEGMVFIYLGDSTGLSSSASVILESNQEEVYFGHTVASVGDVNGDGYSDVIVGAYGYDNGQNNEGAAFIYYGNQGGKSLSLNQLNNADTQKLSYGLNMCDDSFTLSLDTTSPYGRTKVKIEVEFKDKTVPFDGTNLVHSTSWLNSNAQNSIMISGLQQDQEYHYRVRILYKNTTVASAHKSRWIYPTQNIGYSLYDIGRTHIPALSFESASYGSSENNLVTLKVKEEVNVCAGNSIVKVDTADVTTKEGKDYMSSHTILAWDNDVKEKIVLQLNSDDIDENDETFTVTLSSPTNATLGAITTATVTIIDNPSDVGLDSDGDGVEDSLDVWSNDPRFATDSDGDGLPDEWEKSQYGDLTTADGSSDFDGDGYSDLDEFNNFLSKVDPTETETSRVEARRRIPPVLETLTMPEQMNADTVNTISYSLIGYDSDYSTVVAYFDCTGKAVGACGSSFSENFTYHVITQADSISNSQWTYSGEVAQQFDYSYDFTVPSTREGGAAWANSGTDIVVRFYQKTAVDRDAGQGSLSLMLPGDITNEYYDSTGRRILKTICPSGGCN